MKFYTMQTQPDFCVKMSKNLCFQIQKPVFCIYTSFRVVIRAPVNTMAKDGCKQRRTNDRKTKVLNLVSKVFKFEVSFDLVQISFLLFVVPQN